MRGKRRARPPYEQGGATDRYKKLTVVPPPPTPFFSISEQEAPGVNQGLCDYRISRLVARSSMARSVDDGSLRLPRSIIAAMMYGL